jgi:hypothetical protein
MRMLSVLVLLKQDLMAKVQLVFVCLCVLPY